MLSLLTGKPRIGARAGVSLGATMLAITVLCLLASGLATLCVTHLRLTGRMDSGRLAANAARSVASIAISQLLEHPDFGVHRLAAEEVRYQTDDALGLVTFNEDTARSMGMRMSTNNLQGTSDASGDGGSLVPASTVELSVLGSSGGSQRRIDVVLRIPPFPWAIASAGKIDTQNGVLVASLPEGVWPPPTDPAELLPADLVANGSGSGSVVLGNDSLVVGDVDTPGTVTLGQSQVEVRGEIRNGAAPIELPTLRPADYDPQTTGVTYFDITQGDLEEIVGTARAAHSVTFPEKLKLSNGTLYVDGDVTLRAGIEGSGALIATGDITVATGAQIDGLTELAVVSGGRVRLNGDGQSRSMIHGLFYAQEGLEASELTLAGSLLTGSASTGVSLDQVSLYYEPQEGGQGDFPSGDFHFGEWWVGNEPSPVMHVEATDLEPATQQLPPGHSPLFNITFNPTAGGYPVTVTVDLPMGPVRFGPQVINNSDELQSFFANAELALPPLFTQGLPPDIFPVFQQMSTRVQTYSGEELPPPSVVLMGDISRFLPMEDRVRVVSWVER